MRYTSSLKKQFLIGLILGVLLSFIIIFLEPFDSNEFKSDYKIAIFLGFGILVTVVYVVQSLFEKIWYNKVNHIWTVKYELCSQLVFFIVSGSTLYIYNYIFINAYDYSIKSQFLYFTKIQIVIFQLQIYL